MKTLLFIPTLLILVLVSCTSEADVLIKVNIKNNSEHTVNIEYYKANTLENKENIVQGATSSNCEYVFDTFSRYQKCYDSIVVKFPNNKGYISTIPSLSSLEFLNNRGLFRDGFTNIGTNTYQFEITQEDYLNAHDLP